jgi:GT2 family glycosyltransferase
MSRSSQSVAALVLAYSRSETLKQLVHALRSQTRKPDEIIVVFQGSNRAIDQWLTEQPDLHVLRQENKGSAGGFCAGIELSIRRGHAWTWIFDDDAVPDLTALQELVASPYFERPDTTFLASRIVDGQGRTYMSPGAAEANRWYGTVLIDKCVEVVGACWLGIMVNSAAVRRLGLPIAEFFLWDEDIEFSHRLARGGKAYCAISSVIVHYQDSQFDPFGKDFTKFAYYARNNIARARLNDGRPLLYRYLNSVRRALHFTKMIAQRKAPLRSLPWILRGLFLFHPHVRYMD